MSSYEAIDKLCEVTTMLADLVRKQAAIIAQADIPDETKESLSHDQDTVDDMLNIIEYGLRHIHNSGLEEGESNV